MVLYFKQELRWISSPEKLKQSVNLKLVFQDLRYFLKNFSIKKNKLISWLRLESILFFMAQDIDFIYFKWIFLYFNLLGILHLSNFYKCCERYFFKYAFRFLVLIFIYFHDLFLTKTTIETPHMITVYICVEAM